MASKFERIDNNMASGQRLVFYFPTDIFIFAHTNVRSEILVSMADDQSTTGAIGSHLWNTNADERALS